MSCWSRFNGIIIGIVMEGTREVISFSFLRFLCNSYTSLILLRNLVKSRTRSKWNFFTFLLLIKNNNRTWFFINIGIFIISRPRIVVFTANLVGFSKRLVNFVSVIVEIIRLILPHPRMSQMTWINDICPILQRKTNAFRLLNSGVSGLVVARPWCFCTWGRVGLSSLLFKTMLKVCV